MYVGFKEERVSKLVQIEAKDLKWCPYGFEFVDPDGEVRKLRNVHLAHIMNIHTAISIEEYSYNRLCKVQVNPEEYEKAVIERIKEMVDGNIWHIEKKYGAISIKYGHKNEVLECNRDTFVKADPRPWEEEYTIEIGE